MAKIEDKAAPAADKAPAEQPTSIDAPASIDPAAHQAALDELAALREKLAVERDSHADEMERATGYIRSLEATRPVGTLRRPQGTLRTYRAVHSLCFVQDGKDVQVPAGETFEAAPSHLTGLRKGSYKAADPE